MSENERAYLVTRNHSNARWIVKTHWVELNRQTILDLLFEDRQNRLYLSGEPYENFTVSLVNASEPPFSPVTYQKLTETRRDTLVAGMGAMYEVHRHPWSKNDKDLLVVDKQTKLVFSAGTPEIMKAIEFVKTYFESRPGLVLTDNQVVFELSYFTDTEILETPDRVWDSLQCDIVIDGWWLAEFNSGSVSPLTRELFDSAMLQLDLLMLVSKDGYSCRIRKLKV